MLLSQRCFAFTYSCCSALSICKYYLWGGNEVKAQIANYKRCSNNEKSMSSAFSFSFIHILHSIQNSSARGWKDSYIYIILKLSLQYREAMLYRCNIMEDIYSSVDITTFL